MKIHIATIRGLWTYSKYDSEKKTGMPQPPEPYLGEWDIIGQGSVTPTERGFECHIDAEFKAEIWESDRERAMRKAERIVESLSKRMNCNPENAPNGWNIGVEEYAVTTLIEDQNKAVRRHGVKLMWADLVAPNGRYTHGHLKHGLRMDAVIMAYEQAYRELMALEPLDETGRLRERMIALMNSGTRRYGQSTRNLLGIRNADDLKTRLQHMVLDRVKKDLDEWRQSVWLEYDGEIILDEPVIIDPFTVGVFHDDFLLAGRARRAEKIAPQLNPVHSNAREFQDIALIPAAGSHQGLHKVVLHYGVDGSGWDKTIAVAHPGEPLVRFIQRAERIMDECILREKSNKTPASL